MKINLHKFYMKDRHQDFVEYFIKHMYTKSYDWKNYFIIIHNYIRSFC